MTKMTPEREHEILRLLVAEGPFNDETIAERLGGELTTGDVFETTEDLADRGLIEESEFAPGRWQISDTGRAASIKRDRASD